MATERMEYNIGPRYCPNCGEKTLHKYIYTQESHFVLLTFWTHKNTIMCTKCLKEFEYTKEIEEELRRFRDAGLFKPGVYEEICSTIISYFENINNYQLDTSSKEFSDISNKLVLMLTSQHLYSVDWYTDLVKIIYKKMIREKQIENRLYKDNK